MYFLDIHGNQLTSFDPNPFISGTPLYVLDCSRNNLGGTTVDTFQFLGYIHVVALFLDKNNITKFPPGILANLTSLVYLYMDDNKLTTISPGAFKGPYYGI